MVSFRYFWNKVEYIYIDIYQRSSMPNFQLKLLLFAYFIIASLAQDTNETPKLTDVQSADQKVEVPSGTVSVSSPDQK